MFGIACAYPMRSVADDFEDVLDDLMAYRKETRIAAGKQEEPSIEETLQRTEKKAPRGPEVKTAPQKVKGPQVVALKSKPATQAKVK